MGGGKNNHGDFYNDGEVRFLLHLIPSQPQDVLQERREWKFPIMPVISFPIVIILMMPPFILITGEVPFSTAVSNNAEDALMFHSIGLVVVAEMGIF